YRGRTWPKPTGRLMSFSDEQLAALQPYYLLQERQVVRLGGIDVPLDPQLLGRSYLERADVAVLQIIKDQLGKRPITFSRTVGLYADQFNLTGHLEGHGFARVLRPTPIAPSDSVKPLAQLGFVNLPRSATLVFDVYHGDTAARHRPRGWVDHPSEGILTLYGLTYQTLALGLRERSPELAARALVTADSIYKNTSVQLVPPGEGP
ncbi:MAG: hypothetical protein ACREKB_08045, partial [Candidatus Rokuibacteriota bacterium]